MVKEAQFFICKHCGNIVTKLQDSGVAVVCCGDEMTYLAPNTVDAATEKHVPVVELEGNRVRVFVGSVEHPMLEEHYIQWIYLLTDKGFHVRQLVPAQKPYAEFELPEGEIALVAYEYCNLHGLWAKEI